MLIDVSEQRSPFLLRVKQSSWTEQSSETQMDIYHSTRRNISEGKETLSRPVGEPQISGRQICVCDINSYPANVENMVSS